MRILLGFLLIIGVYVAVQPMTVHAEVPATSYGFASGERPSVDRHTSGIGLLIDRVDSFLGNFRGTRGTMLFMVCASLALGAVILGLPHAALSFAIVAGGVVLLNKPLLLAVALAPVVVIKRHLIVKRRRAEEEGDDSNAGDLNRKGSKKKKRNRKRKSLSFSGDSEPRQRSSSLNEKLGRPI